VQEEERLWGVLIDKYEGVSAPWAADILGRAYGNRGERAARARPARQHCCSQAATRALCAAGNARSRQGKWDAALADLTRAQEICPWSVDPVLNRRAPRDLCALRQQGSLSWPCPRAPLPRSWRPHPRAVAWPSTGSGVAFRQHRGPHALPLTAAYPS